MSKTSGVLFVVSPASEALAEFSAELVEAVRDACAGVHALHWPAASGAAALLAARGDVETVLGSGRNVVALLAADDSVVDVEHAFFYNRVRQLTVADAEAATSLAGRADAIISASAVSSAGAALLELLQREAALPLHSRTSLTSAWEERWAKLAADADDSGSDEEEAKLAVWPDDSDLDAELTDPKPRGAAHEAAIVGQLPEDAEDGSGGAAGMGGVGGGSGGAAGDGDGSPAGDGGFSFTMEEAGAGDEFSAVKPWVGSLVPPSDAGRRRRADDGDAPDAEVELEWVHGIRCRDVRGSLAVLASGELAFFSASVGVVWDSDRQTQRYFLQHSDDIISMAVAPDGRTVATGEIGRRPVIYVWDSGAVADGGDGDGGGDDGGAPAQPKRLAALSRFHRRGVCRLAFSPDGRLLASIGLDDDHTLAVWDWRAGRLVASAACGGEKVLALAWAPGDADRLAVAGVRSLKLFTLSSSNVLRAKKGLFGRRAKMQPLLSAAFIGRDTLLTGTASGAIYVWRGRKCAAVLKGSHSRAVNALVVSEAAAAGEAGYFYSAARDGVVTVWAAPALEAVRTHAPDKWAAAGSADAALRSAALSPDGRSLLLLTRSAEVWRLDALSDGVADGPLARAHAGSRAELWGVAAHPTDAAVAASVGDDGLLAIWQLTAHRMLRSTQLPGPARAVAWSPDGSQLAVALGGRLGGTRDSHEVDGSFLVLDADSLDVVARGQDAAEWSEAIAWSPDGSLLALGSHDNAIYVYEADRDYTLRDILRAHASFITAFDFSADGRWMRSSCGGYEALFWDVGAGRQLPGGASQLKDEDWATCTVPLVWESAGIWSSTGASLDGSDINAIARSPAGSLLAAGDDFGGLRLYRAPVAAAGASALTARGHSSHVAGVAWTADGMRLLTAGGGDLALMQWRVSCEDAEEAAEQAAAAAAAAAAGEEDDELAAALTAEGSLPPRSAALDWARNDELFTPTFVMEEVGAGDEFTAVKPWMGAVVPPTEAPPPPTEPSAPPDVDAELHYVYGYRARDVRGNIHFSADGRAVYPVAGVVVTQSLREREQTHYVEAGDDVLSLAVAPGGKLAAAGEIGRRPKIFLFDPTTQQTRAVLTGFHRRGVCQLAFDGSGSLLGSVGVDDDHRLAIHDTASGQLLASAKTGGAKVLGLALSADGSRAVTCGTRHIKFWKLTGRSLRPRKGLFGRSAKLQTLLAAAFLPNGDVVSGAADGSLLLWRGRKCVRVVAAHERAVYSLVVTDAGVATGGADGRVRLWDHDLEPRATLNVAEWGPASPKVRAVAWQPESRSLLVGTASSDIFHVSEEGAAVQPPLVTGHARDELWGLAPHPTQQMFATVGDDRTLRVWDAGERRQLSSVTLPTMSRAVAYSPDGSLLAIGLGGRVGGGGSSSGGGGGSRRGKEPDGGGFIVYRLPGLEVEHQVVRARDAKEWISDIKFSPDGSLLALASHDNRIYLYTVADGYSLAATLKGHSSYVTHMDFSADGAWLRSTCGAYELLFWDVAAGRQQPSASALRDVDWATTTVTLGWEVAGIWPPFADGTDINAVDRSRCGSFLASADDFGKLKLFRYPLPDTQGDMCYRGHSSHVMNVRWGAGDRYLWTAGGNDRAIFQWRVEKDDDDEEEVERGDGGGGGGGGKAGEEDDDWADGGVPAGGKRAELAEAGSAAEYGGGGAAADADGDSGASESKADWSALDGETHGEGSDPMAFAFTMEEVGSGDEFSAVKPWLGAIVPPSDWREAVELADAPSEQLVAHHVHGYTSKRSRNNVRYSAAGDALFHAAGLGVIMNTSSGRQRFHSSHSDDILCLAVSPDGQLVATGQMGRRPYVTVWDAASGAEVSRLTGFHRRAVLEVTFSADGSALATVGQDDDHSLAVYHVASATLIGSAKGDKKKALALEFNPASSSDVVVCGVDYVRFYSRSGRNFKCKRGRWGKRRDLQQPLLSLAFAGGDTVVTGALDGQLLLWRGGKLKGSRRAHERAVSAMHFSDSAIVSAGADGRIVMWTADSSVRPLRKFSLPDAAACLSHELRSVALHPSGERLLVGTRSGDLLQLRADDGSLLGEPLLRSHFRGELWAVDSHPRDSAFATAGDDETVRLWDGKTRKQTAIARLPDRARTLRYSPDGSSLAVGMENGSVSLLSLPSLRERAYRDVSTRAITQLKFSPDGATLAVASRDSRITLLDATDGSSLSRRAVCKGHSSTITHIDFSADSRWLQSNCAAYELLFWNARTGRQVKSASTLRDVEWATWTCTLGWPVQGIWPERADGTDVNAVDRSGDGRLLAYADDFGKVKLLQYPCTMPGARASVGRAHSSHVTNVCWLSGDRYVVSTGGADDSIVQWKVVS